MPRLKELLTFLTKPGLEDIWLLLDLKPDNDADELMRLVASTIADVKPSRPWKERIVLGCWRVSWFVKDLRWTLWLTREGKLYPALQ
jgi:phosphatidylglycerol phospholipase C